MSAADNGVSPSEEADADRLVARLAAERDVAFVALYRQRTGLYEIVGRTGSVSFRRRRAPGGQVGIEIVHVRGKSPVVDSAHWPDVLRRIATVFDHERSPDIYYVRADDADGGPTHRGGHGSPNVLQSTAPLVIAGPGVAGGVSDAGVAVVDIAPTIAHYLGISPLVGIGPDGSPRTQLLRRQDGESLVSPLAGGTAAAAQAAYGAAQQAVVFVLDGVGSELLMEEVRSGTLPNIARLVARGTTFRRGSLVAAPSVTWANHNSLVTGTAPGTHGFISNGWYERGSRTQRTFGGGNKQQWRSSYLLAPRVETLFEAVRRTWGDGAHTLSANSPGMRGATVATIDVRGYERLLLHAPALALAYLRGALPGGTPDPDGKLRGIARLDQLGAVLAARLAGGGGAPPKLSVVELLATDESSHHFGPRSVLAREALRASDRRVGMVLDAYAKQGRFDSTMFVVTADHGQQQQPAAKRNNIGRAIKRSGVRIIDRSGFIYIRNMVVAVTVAGVAGGQVLRVRIRDDDLEQGGGERPLAATVELRDQAGAVIASARASASGEASLAVPAGGGRYRLVVRNEGFTTLERDVEVGVR